jgi:histidinol phosphatase-like enzyme
MLLQAAEEFGCELTGVPFIGDKLSDVKAAQAVGARPILVGSGAAVDVDAGVERFTDLRAAAAALIGEREAQP